MLGGEYKSAAARWEGLSLGVCDQVQLEHDDAVTALSTTCASERFEILLKVLRPALSEVAALSALAGVGGDVERAATSPSAPPGLGDFGPGLGAGFGLGSGGFTPIDIPVGDDVADAEISPRSAADIELPSGSRVEYWWNEELGWCAATVRRSKRGRGASLWLLSRRRRAAFTMD